MRRSATTYITATRAGLALLAAAEATRDKAIARLAGPEVEVVGCHELDGDCVAVTWRREYEEPEEPAAAPSPPDA